MIKANINNNEAEIQAEGKPIELMTELFTLVGKVIVKMEQTTDLTFKQIAETLCDMLIACEVLLYE